MCQARGGLRSAADGLESVDRAARAGTFGPSEPIEEIPMSTRIAIITGGSRGLGKSMALHLADHGVDTVFTYRAAASEAAEVVAQIEAKGRKAVALPLDVRQIGSYDAFVAEVVAKLASVWQRTDFDYLVNNAGTGLHAPFLETTEAQLDDMFATHLKSAFFLTQKLVPRMVDGGRVVNVSTGLARFAFPGYAAYATMKGGLEVLSRYMAKELGARGIAVNVLAPGAIETDFGGGVVRDVPEVNRQIASMTAMGRVGLPDDIGGALAMLLAPENRWITGQRIEASGGMML
jgi:NAD(P)-dependent dehydrogenase (short-subunit alcohol dehydrogenase family)